MECVSVLQRCIRECYSLLLDGWMKGSISPFHCLLFESIHFLKCNDKKTEVMLFGIASNAACVHRELEDEF